MAGEREAEVYVVVFEDILEKEVVDSVEDAYQELLEDNLRYQVGELPRDMRNQLASEAAEIYGSQARRILESDYLEPGDVELAMATAFLDESRQNELAVKTRSIFRGNEGLRDLDEDRYEERALTVLNDPWPPQDLGTGVERFKDHEDDPAFH